MTKYKGRLDTLRLLSRIGFISLSGRPSAAPQRTTSWDVGKPVKPPRENQPIATDSCEQTGCIGTTPLTMLQDMTLQSCVMEGRSLTCEGKVPHRGSRILVWVHNLVTGEDEYRYSGPVPDEPDLTQYMHNEPRPHLLTTWAVPHSLPTGPP